MSVCPLQFGPDSATPSPKLCMAYTAWEQMVTAAEMTTTPLREERAETGRPADVEPVDIDAEPFR